MGIGLYGNSMHGFVMRELEIGYRAAAHEDSELCGWGPLWDLIFELDMRQQEEMAPHLLTLRKAGLL